MKIENQVCAPEQAKRLKELGVLQTGYFFWMEVAVDEQDGKFVYKWCLFRPNTGESEFHTDSHLNGYEDESLETGEEADAFTVAEFGAILPVHLSLKEHGCFVLPLNEEVGRSWNLITNDHSDEDEPKLIVYNTEAEAKAEALIFLLKSGTITAEEVNNRLLNA